MNASQVALRTAHKDFIKHLKEKGRATATILAYGNDIKQLVDFCGKNAKLKAADIATHDLEVFKAFLAEEKYTPKSISRKINSIKTFFRFLVVSEIIEENPATPIAHPKYKIQPPRILSKMEYRALRDACRNDLRASAIIELFLQTGIRIGELANLKLEDVSDAQIIIKPYESHPKREIPLNKAAHKAVNRYLENRPKSRSTNLFITKTGKPFLIRNIRSAIDRYFRIAGIKDTKVNDLRHTFIAHQLKAGTPIVVVSRLVGHKRLSTTEKYLEFIKEKSFGDSLKLSEL